MEKATASKPEPQPAPITIGIDVSEDHLDAARHPGGETICVANTRKGQTALLRWIADMKVVARVVFEPNRPVSPHAGQGQTAARAASPKAPASSPRPIVSTP
ncbi:hypothetical protein [Gluconacetobacter sp.]|uniref:hypothetical protein n=1 Tax=Gluconacetobacter sp. TaxID=1935994 RepID=UPI0039E897B1